MTEFTSEIQTIPHNNRIVYETLSDLNNLDKFKSRIPSDKVEDFAFDSNSCSFSIQPVGKVKFSIIDREPPKTIKFASEQSPVAVNIWIQLKETGEQETKLKLTVRADLNPILEAMLSKTLREGVNKIAATLAAIPYETRM